MKNAPAWLLGSLVLIILVALFSSNLKDTGGDDGRPIVESPPAAYQDRLPTAPTVLPETGREPQSAKIDSESADDAAAAPAMLNGEPRNIRHAIRRVLAQTWLDAETKLERRQVRVVEADFKYPRLRLEEVVSTDPATGETEVTPVRASVADHVLVGVKAGADVAEAKRQIELQGYQIRAEEADSYLLVALPDHEDAGAQAKHMAALQQLGGIDYAEPDWLVYPSVLPNDPAMANGILWGLDNPGNVAGTLTDADVDAPEAWAVRANAPGVVVAVTDTGIRYTHQDLAANIWTNEQGHHGYDAYDLDNDPMDPDGHGTHVAGTIGAVGNNGLGITGVAWDVDLMALRFIGLYGGATSDAITVINYARMNGADVISASWGGAGESRSLEDAIRACHSAGIPFVAAAGNLNMNNDSVPHFPSSFRVPNIVSVAATDANDSLASFSNHGRFSVDVTAPGDNIWSCGIASDSDYRYLSGTSMAAPHVAGALALAKVHFPGESCEDLINRMYRSVDKPSALRNRVSTSGRLNLHKLLVASDPEPPHNHFNTALWYTTRYWEWSGSNARMTQEDDEEVLNSGLGTRSMWFFWTAPANGLARIKGEAELGDLILEVYKGNTRTGRQLIRDNINERPTRSSELFFNASKGQTYSICMDSAHALPQQMGIQAWLYPVNDMFDHAIDLGSGTRIANSGDNTGATTESFEMNMRHGGHRADRSIWWKWTPTFSGPFVLGTQRSEIDTVLAVYTGTKGSLVETASNDDVSAQDWTSQVTMNVESGTTYHIVVDSYSSHSTGKIELDGYRPDELFILKQPQGVSVKVGGEATFRVAVAGTDLRYQWEFNGQPIPGAVLPSHTVRGVLPQDYGSYRVRISNLANQIYSNAVALSEISTMPRIVWQSRSLNASAGETVNLLVEVTGSEPMTYQWYKEDVPIEEATGKKLELTNVSATNEGIYRFTATNALGSVPSSPMLLSVYSSPWEGWQSLDQANQSGAVFGIVYQDGQWVAASRAYPGTRISISQDGRNWKHRIVNPLTPVTSCFGSFLVYGNGTWLFGGQGDNGLTIGVVYKSTDLVNWQQINIGIPLYNHKALFHDGAFFLMNGSDSFSAKLYRSVDGVTWHKQLKQNGTDISARPGMASSPHGLLLCGNTYNSAESAFFLPTSSTVWQAIDINPTRTEISDGVFWFKDRYIASASGIYESLNGVNWSGPLATTAQRYPGYPIYQSWLVEHGNHVYGNANGSITSLDGGLTWTTSSSIYPQNTQAGASNGSLMVFGTSKGGLFATENPSSANYSSPMMNTIQDMRYEGGKFIVQTSTNHNGSLWPAFAVSADSETWNMYPLLRIDNTAGSFGGFNVKWINNEFWRDGRNVSATTENFFRGPVPSSSWEAKISGLNGTYLVDYAEGPAGILAVRLPGAGTYGDLVKSTDGGATWATVSIPGGTPTKHSKLECLGGVYVHYASLTADYVSADLVNWTSVGEVDYITKHNGLYRAWKSGSFMTSSDMLNWSAWTFLPSKGMAKPVSFGGAMVTTSNNRLEYSYDGIAWVPADVGFMPSYLASTGDVLLVAGSGGQLARAGSVTKLAPVVSITEPLAGSVSVEGGQVKVSVNSFNANQAGHPTVKLFGDGLLVAEKSAPPYEFELPISEAGGHLVHVEARQGTGPVAFDHRHIKVVASTPANSYRGISGASLLPGYVQYLNGAYFSFGRVDGGTVGRSSLVMMSHDLDTWVPVSKQAMVKAVSGNNRLVTLETYDPGVPYAPISNVIAVTSDGVNWLKVQLPAAVITPLYFSHGHFWAMAQSGVMFSEDGINWSFRGFKIAPGGSSTVSSIDPVGDPNGTMIARVPNNGIWRTTDGGANWLRILQNLSSPGVPVIDGSDFFIWGTIGSIKHFGSSTNGGATWSFAPYPSSYLSLTMVNRTVFAFGSFNRLLAVSQDGVNWHNFDVPWMMGSIISGDDGYFHTQVSEAGVEGIYRSADGIDWQKEACLPTTQSFSLFDTPDGLFATTSNGGLWRLLRETEEWQVISEPTVSSVTFKRIAGEDERFVAMADQLLLTSDDDGQSWEKAFDPAGAALASIQFTDLFYRSGVWLAWDDRFALLRSTDGTTFTDVTSATGAAGFEVIAPGASGWLAIKGDGSVWSSLDGLSWTSHAPPGSYPDSDVVMLRELNGQWYALSADASITGWDKTRLLVSTDGLSWQVTNMPRLNGAMVLTQANGILMAGDVSAQRYSSNLTSWTNTFANSSVFAGSDAFYLIRNGWLERSVTGTSWVQHRQIDAIYSAGQFLDGSIFLLGQDRISRIPVADVRVKSVSMTAGVFAVKDTIEFSVQLVNTGASVLPAKKYPMEVFLSLDGYHGDEDDSSLGMAMVNVPEVQPGDSATVTVSARIPNRVSPGDFRISVVFDRERAVYEKSAANNFCMSKEVLVTIPAWRLTTNSNGQGQVNQDSNQRLFANGSMVSLIATAGKGAAFTGWGGDAVGVESQISVLMNGDKTVQANFTSRHTLQVYIEGAGEVTGLADQGSYAPGASANLTAVEADGWVFAGWSDAATGSVPSANITMDGSKALTATFKLPLNNWRPKHFSSGELANNSIAGDDADPDGDGLKNWQEYLHGSNPRNKASKGRNQSELERGFLSVIHTRLSGPQSGMSVRCVGSRNLHQWDAPDLQERVLSVENGVETVETRIPVAGNDRGFLRFHYVR